MWYLLDKDANGCVTVEEFDYENAQATRLCARRDATRRVWGRGGGEWGRGTCTLPQVHLAAFQESEPQELSFPAKRDGPPWNTRNQRFHPLRCGDGLQGAGCGQKPLRPQRGETPLQEAALGGDCSSDLDSLSLSLSFSLSLSLPPSS